jgi:hypothetical protein
METPTHYTLTRIAHPTWCPEILESYLDSASGELFTGAYLKHAVGDSEVVSAHVAKVVMTDPGLKHHYTCEPPFQEPIVEPMAEPKVESVTEVSSSSVQEALPK